MTKLVAACCAIGALVLPGCGEIAGRAVEPPSAQTATSAVEQDETLECRADDVAWQYVDVSFSPAAQNVPFRCIRLESATAMQAGGRENHVVNIDARGGSAPAGQLQIALHEIKTKHFLKGRSLSIISDGRRFGAIERECVAMRAAGIDDVTAVIPTAAVTTSRMTAREFIAERAYGVWRFENRSTQEDLDSPLFLSTGNPELDFSRQRGRQGSVGLVRTLLVYDSNAQESEGHPPYEGEGQVFVLEGGLEGLRQYEQEAAAMARARARPRIAERGCAG